MRRACNSPVVFAAILLVTPVIAAQAQAGAPETARAVAGGGISVAGWAGKIDAGQAGVTLADARLTKEGDALHVITGPAVAYWNPANTASGNYTVKATFKEPQYMGLNSHPHPYGIFIGGNDMGTDQQTYLYCAAYGNGTFIVRGFGPGAVPAQRPRRPSAVDPQGRGQGRAGHAGNRGLGQGRQGRVRDQRHGRRVV